MTHWIYQEVDLADNSTTVDFGPSLLRQIHVTTVLSAHACSIKDNTTVIGTIPASTAVGVVYQFGDMKITTSLIVDPNDSGTGKVIVVYQPLGQ